MKNLYSIGIDFGTLSVRGVLVNVRDGEEVAELVANFSDGVIDDLLPETTKKLPLDYALQNPADYYDGLVKILGELWKKANVLPEQIIGIGIDFTACTMIPLDKKMMPLCYQTKFRENIHSWAKLWKHHGAQEQANRLNKIAIERNEKFIQHYGGTSSSEWLFAKVLEILEKAPEIYEATYRFAEAADWIVFLLTGEYKKNSVTAGFKGFWNADEGFPSDDYFAAVHPKMEKVVEEKVGSEVYAIGGRAGKLTVEMAEKTGLKPGIGIAFGNIDAHVSFPAVGAAEPATMLMIMGTSLCHIYIDRKEVLMKGISGVVKHGVLPGFYGYEAGQAAVGDIYQWFMRNHVPQEYMKEAESRGIDLYELFNAKIAKIKPGSSGLLALDWWNGNRSPLVDADLSGLIIGLTLSTKPEEIYRAIVESTAFGSRIILESFEKEGLKMKKIFACGGLAQKNPEVMQIFSDVLGKEIQISGVTQTSAFGSAMFGAVAAGSEAGGYDDIIQAVKFMPRPSKKVYKPNYDLTATYDSLFQEYTRLHEYFGLEKNNVMKKLKRIKLESVD